jgi:Sulfatase
VRAAALHLAVLSSFAFAQPLFDLLGRTPEFFAVRGATPTEIVVFALALVLVPPLVLVAVEAASGPARGAVHLGLVGGLVGLVALQASGRIVVAVLIGAAAAVAYARLAPARALVTALSPAPLVFLALFLFWSPASDLVSPEDVAHASPGPVHAQAPVVVVVFDEFAGMSLMDGEGRLDAARYPGFARLARNASWYRNAVSVSKATERAVPAILTGRHVERGTLPILADHPNNLFTLLGQSHELNVHEGVTRLCPARFCPQRARRTLRSDVGLLIEDLGVVYLHTALPERLRDRLPGIDNRWENFRGGRRSGTAPDRAAALDRFVRSVGPRRRPALHFLHVLLPHAPYEYVPSGRRYDAPPGLPGLRHEEWEADPRLVGQAQQRYLLQVGYVDRFVGRLLDRLEATGLLDRALVVVTADHGVSFHANDGRRTSRRYLQDIAFVPLFVKLPRQTAGRVVERPIATSAILPLITDELAIELPWRADTGAAMDGEPLDVAALAKRRDEAAARQAERFGSGGWTPVYGYEHGSPYVRAD